MPTLQRFSSTLAKAFPQLTVEEYRDGHHGLDVDGGALFGLLNPSNKMTHQAKSILQKYGDLPIGDIKVYRQPVSSVIMSVLNATSLGAIKKNMRKVGYDRMFHLYCVIQLRHQSEGHHYLLIEKNAVVNIEIRRNLNAKHEEAGSKQRMARVRITLRQLFEETIARVGEHTFFSYDPVRNNCQDFILMLLDTLYSGNVPPPLRRFVKQDRVAEVVDSPAVQAFAHEVTDIGGWFQRVLRT